MSPEEMREYVGRWLFVACPTGRSYPCDVIEVDDDGKAWLTETDHDDYDGDYAVAVKCADIEYVLAPGAGYRAMETFKALRTLLNAAAERHPAKRWIKPHTLEVRYLAGGDESGPVPEDGAA